MDAELICGIIRHIEYTIDMTHEQKICVLTRIINDREGYNWLTTDNSSGGNIINNCPNIKALLVDMIKLNKAKEEKTGNSILLKMCDENAKFVDDFISGFLTKESQEINKMLEDMFSDTF
jgi:hypothetical protein